MDRAVLITHLALHNHPLRERDIIEVASGDKIVARVEVRPPMRDELDQFDENYPWNEAMQAQVEAHAQLRAAVSAYPDARVIYMGFAPIPLVFHLGRLIGDHTPVEIFQYDRQARSWLWPSEEPTPSLLERPSLPAPDPISTHDVLLRVSASYRVGSQDTAKLSAAAMHDCCLELRRPEPGALRSSADLWALAAEFRALVDAAHERFPSARVRHLAASVPVGAALAMGMQLNPTIHLPLQTWKYLGNRRRRYVPAARLGHFVDLPKVLLLGAAPVDHRPITVVSEVQELGDLLGQHEGELEVVSRPAAGVESLTLKLAELDPTVLHIASHGLALVAGGRLSLTAPDGWSSPVDTDDLVRVLARAPSLLCVILNACESEVLARVLAETISAAIGWKQKTPDALARRFALALWSSLIAGHSVLKAFADAQLVLGDDRAQVVLALREGVDGHALVPFPRV